MEGLSSLGEELRELLSQQGALFANDLLQQTRMLPDHLQDTLGELIARGMLTSDSFSGLRSLMADKLDASSRRTDGPPKGYVRKRSTTAGTGRWSLWRRPLPSTEGTEQAAHVEAWAWQLLRRWGVMFRDLLERETGAPRWWELLQVYRRLEARGELRGGRFITGVAGEQFALESTVRRLREVRDAASDVSDASEKRSVATHDGSSDDLLAVTAADPLNLTGVLDANPRVPSLATNRVAYLNGVAVAAIVAGELVWLTKVSATDQQRIAEFLAREAEAIADSRRRNRRSSRRPHRRSNSANKIPRPIIR